MDLQLQEKISHMLHVSPISTEGINTGVIWKLPTHYIKVYDTKGINMFHLQVYRYERDIPFIDMDVPLNELLKFIRGHQK